MVLGYALYLCGHYVEAAEVWNTVVQQSSGTDPRARVMLAASLDRAGKAQDAKTPVELFFPNLSGGDLYSFVTFQEMLRMKAVAERKSGDTTQAEHYEKLVKLYYR